MKREKKRTIGDKSNIFRWHMSFIKKNGITKNKKKKETANKNFSLPEGVVHAA